jgi:hypothetical protein
MTNLAEYRFKEYDDRTRAKDKLHDHCGGYNSCSFTSGDSEHPYGLCIKDECTDASLAAKICEANGGQRF